MLRRRYLFLCLSLVICAIVLFYRSQTPAPVPANPSAELVKPPTSTDRLYNWATRPQGFPISSFIPIPNGTAHKIPRIQHAFVPESRVAAEENERRRAMVKSTFVRTWEGYKNRAWLEDELLPISGGFQSNSGGWAATLVDTLDTLWIMDLKIDFAQAAGALGEIDFTQTEKDEVNLCQTTIRYLGGLLAARDLCGDDAEGERWKEILLVKAVQLGEFLYAAFDTENRMPITRWKWSNARYGKFQEAESAALLAELGSLSMEFTRLSQVTGDPKFYDAIQRITDRLEKAQDSTNLPGLWPLTVNPKVDNFGDSMDFAMGAMADTAYEYLLKEYILLGGQSTQYWELYDYAMETAKEYLFFRPITKSGLDILISGQRRVLPGTVGILDPQGQHLACFAGGMLALGSKTFSRPDDLQIAQKLVDGCLWAHHSMPTGIMPEVFHVTPCPDPEDCAWVEQPHTEDPIHFPEFFDIPDKRFILRPEMIESLFILYRITGDESLRDEAWELFNAIEKHTKTAYGNAAISDVTQISPPKDDFMEPFWTAETLKYFYLIFSSPDFLSLDKWVFNTGAHPFKRSPPRG